MDGAEANIGPHLHSLRLGGFHVPHHSPSSHHRKSLMPLRPPAGNPILRGIGLSDPHVFVHNDRAYLFATHDFSPASTWFVTKDWWVWSSTDLVHWRQESTMFPQDTFWKSASNECWAGFGVCKNAKWYWYFSAGAAEIGVVVADTPAGPWQDPLGRPLIAKGMVPTDSRDPDVLIDDDGQAYIVFGTFDYFIAKLGEDMISLAETPRPLMLDQRHGPYGAGRTDDKPSLHCHGGRYYLSWSSFYAISDAVYGPYRFMGTVLEQSSLAPEFSTVPDSMVPPDWDQSFAKNNFRHDRHGNFFTFHGQTYFTSNDKSLPGRNEFFRDSVICYAHYRDDGRILPVRIDPLGVGQYTVETWIPAVEFFRAVRATKRIHADGESEVTGLSTGSVLIFPQVHGFAGHGTATFRYACNGAAGCSVEVRDTHETGEVLGYCHLPSTDHRPGFHEVSCPLRIAPGTHSIALRFLSVESSDLRLTAIRFR